MEVIGFIIYLLVCALVLYLLIRLYGGVFFASNTRFGGLLLVAVVFGVMNVLWPPVSGTGGSILGL